MMDPQTGAVLAIASRPSFQLSTLDLSQSTDLSLLRLRAVTDEYEPGSVFKLITTAGALDEGKVTPNTPYIDTGEVTVGGRKFHNWDFSTNGKTSVTEMLIKSLNLGAIWVAQVLGADDFYKYVQAFGLASPRMSASRVRRAAHTARPTIPSGHRQISRPTASDKASARHRCRC